MHRIITDYLREAPHSIEPHQTIHEARRRMKKWNCDHLPVLSGGQIVGILTDRDMVFACGLGSEDDHNVSVGDVMITEVISLDVSSPLNIVIKAMVQNQIGSIIITKDGKLHGIFTETDALRALLDILES